MGRRNDNWLVIDTFDQIGADEEGRVGTEATCIGEIIPRSVVFHLGCRENRNYVIPSRGFSAPGDFGGESATGQRGFEKFEIHQLRHQRPITPFSASTNGRAHISLPKFEITKATHTASELG